MAGSTKLSLFIVLGGIALVALFLWTVFLSGAPLLTTEIWKLDQSMSKEETAAWRKKPGSYTAPSLQLRPGMSPIAVAIAHWSEAASFPRSSQFIMEVRDPTGQRVYQREISLRQTKNEGGSDIAILNWTASTASLTQLPEHLEITEPGLYTFRLLPGEQQDGNHSRLQLRLRQQAIPPQWWMFITGFPMVFIGVFLFIFSSFKRMRKSLEDLPGTEKKG